MFQLEVFPGADRQFVTQLLEGFLATNTLNQALNLTMDRLLDMPMPAPQDAEITVRFQAIRVREKD